MSSFSLSSVKNAPAPILLYGVYAAIVPYFLFPVLTRLYSSQAADFIFAHNSYCSAIITFIGAVKWANIVALSEAKEKKMSCTYVNMGLAVLPAVIGWVALLAKGSAGLTMLVVGFLFLLAQDLTSDIYPHYYKAKNIILEVLGIISVLLL